MVITPDGHLIRNKMSGAGYTAIGEGISAILIIFTAEKGKEVRVGTFYPTGT